MVCDGMEDEVSSFRSLICTTARFYYFTFPPSALCAFGGNVISVAAALMMVPLSYLLLQPKVFHAVKKIHT